MDSTISRSLWKAAPLSTHNGGSSPGVSHAAGRAEASNPEANLPGETRTSRRDEHLHETRGTSRKRSCDEGEEIEHGHHAENKRYRLDDNTLDSRATHPPINGQTKIQDRLVEPDRRIRELEAEVSMQREKLSDLAKQLDSERSLRIQSDNDISVLRQTLDEERQSRARAELIVSDIRREMNDPFVVPSLLDCFIAISDASMLYGNQ